MAKYNVTYNCGHTGVVALFGPNKDREWKLAREEEKLCPECYKEWLERERIKQNEEAAETNQRAGLPALEGTEKQIAWAETIRHGVITEANRLLENAKHYHDKNSYFQLIDLPKEQFIEALESIGNHTNASWWIDNRYNTSSLSLPDLLRKEYENLQKERMAPPAQIIADAQIEATVRPEEALTETVAEISISDNTVKIHFPEKRDDFRKVVKELKFSWGNGHWKREIKSRNGTPEDRAAEIGHHLLAQGFIIRIFDETIRQKAISGEYEKEYTNWIMARISGKYEGWLAISWDRKDDFYNASRRLPCSRYDSPNVVVPPEQYEEILDFANRYCFQISDTAKELIDSAKAAKEATLVAKVIPPEKEKSIAVSSKPTTLDVPQEVEIANELKDN